MIGSGLRLVCAVFFISALLPVPGHGSENLDDILFGFDEVEELDDFYGEDEPGKDDVLSHETATLPSWLDLYGSISLATALNYDHKKPDPGEVDHRDFSKLKLTGDINADIKISSDWQARLELNAFYDLIYDLKGRDEYPKRFLDDYEKELELGEAWIQGSLFDDLDIKAGRQIVVWGKSDNIRVTDILNPLDNREPGLVDIEYLRLPVAMTKVDYYRGFWHLSGMVLHEVRLPKNPVYGSDFYPGSSPLPREDKPGMAWRNQEFALAANGIFSGWDISFYGAAVFNDLAHIEQTATGVERKHSRLKMAGSAINVAFGNWLVKGEVALLDGLEYSIPMEEKTRLDSLIGVEYSGIDETMLSFELANRHIFAFDSRLKQAPYYKREDDVQTVFRMNRDFYNDTLQLTCLLSFFGLSGNNGSFQRFSLEYEMTANTFITAGLMTYQSGDKAAFRDIGDNDRIFLEMRTYF